MKKEKVVYYDDEANDDFSGITRDKVVVDEKFKYINDFIVYKAMTFIVYQLVRVYAFFYSKAFFSLRIIGKKKLKKEKNGYFIYANHTQIPGDAFFQNLVTFPKKSYVLVHPDNIALKGTKNLILMLGAIPLFTKLSGARGFNQAIEKRVKRNPIVIYPEAHIWPYYTKIRSFNDVSFKYPLKLKKPIYSYTVTYQKRKYRRPKITIFVDGPYVVDKTLSIKEQQEAIRNQVYEKMTYNTRYSDVEYIKYIHREKIND